MQEEAPADVLVPVAFTEILFDRAESEIKYLILTNTWLKSVNAGCAMRESAETE